MAVRDPAFGQIVGGKLHGYAVSSENADTIAAEFAGEVGENGTVGI